MPLEYWEHPDYGRENRNDKVITIAFRRELNDAQWDAIDVNGPQLDARFNLSYCDGIRDCDHRVSHDWEKTDQCPRGLLGYSLSKKELRIWASEAITPEYFADAARYVIAEAARAADIADARIGVSSSGIAISCFGKTLGNLAATLDVAEREFKEAPKAAPKGPKAPGL